MATPVRCYSRDDYHWVWSKHGPADRHCRALDHLFTNGILPWPVPGDRARELEGLGYITAPALPGHLFQEWKNSDGTWVPVFAEVIFKPPKKRRGRPPKKRVEATT